MNELRVKTFQKLHNLVKLENFKAKRNMTLYNQEELLNKSVPYLVFPKKIKH